MKYLDCYLTNVLIGILLIGIYGNIHPEEKREINCGVVSLWYCARLEGVDISMDEISSLFKPETEEISMYDLFQAAQKLGLSAMGVRMSWEELLGLKSPAIAWVNKNHFVVVERVVGDKILVVDYPNPAKLYTQEKFEKIWSGELLIVSRLEVHQFKEGSPPKIVFKELVYDFGIVEGDTITTHSFVFYNAGGKTLKITGLKKGCGCTAVVVGKKELQPGEKSEIVVKFDTRGRKGFQKQVVSVRSNDPEKPKVVLTITAVVKREIEVNPSMLYFGEVGVGESRTKELYVIESGDGNLQIKEVKSGSTAFRVKAKPFTKVQDNFKRWVIEVTLLSQKEPGILKDEIIIKTNSEKKPVVKVPVEAEIVGDLAFVPSSLFFGVLHPGDKVERGVRLYSRNGQEFMIKEVYTNGLPVEVNYKPQVKSKEHTITFVLVAPEETEMLKRQIEIKVASGKEEILHLPLLALIRK